MTQGLTLSIVGFVVACALAGSASAVASTPRERRASLGTGLGDRVVQPRTRTVCVSATDKNGSAVADLQASEFQVKEGGKTAEVLSAQPATMPLRIALIVADGGTGAFQLGMATFMQRNISHLSGVGVHPRFAPSTMS